MLAKQYSKSLIAAEKNLSKILRIEKYTPTELMSVRTEHRLLFYKDGFYNMYNCISLRIYSDKIMFRFHNQFSGEIFEIEINPY